MLRFLGCGAAFYPTLGNNSAYWTRGEDFFLIDCGETVFASLLQCPAFRVAKRVHLFVTHLHSDHVGSLGTFLAYAEKVSHQEVRLYRPADTNLVALLNLLSIGEQSYVRVTAMEGELPTGDAYRFVPVTHVPSLVCYGLELYDREQQLWHYYSSDSIQWPEGILERFERGELDTLYQDVGPNGVPVHLNEDVLLASIEQAQRSRVVAMHLSESPEDPTSYAYRLKEAGFVLATELMDG